MSIRDLVTFHAEFPDDAVWDEFENLLVPGGRAIADELRRLLMQKGYACEEIVQHSFYGWAFETIATDMTVGCLLQGGEEWFLILEQKVPFLVKLGAQGPFEQFQDAVQHILLADKRFSKIQWHNNNEYKRGINSRGIPCPR